MKAVIVDLLLLAGCCPEAVKPIVTLATQNRQYRVKLDARNLAFVSSAAERYFARNACAYAVSSCVSLFGQLFGFAAIFDAPRRLASGSTAAYSLEFTIR